jgi:drug/metabolite transporter (DMT)-like permease
MTRGRGVALALVSAVAFGSSGPFAKPVMDTGTSPLQVTSVRIGLAAVILFGLVALLRPSALRFSRSDSGLLFGYGGLGVIGAPLFFFVAAARIPVGVAMLLEFTAPVLVALWVRFVRGTRLPKAMWAGITLAMLGLAMVAQVPHGLRMDAIGLIAGLCSAVCTAGYYLLGEHGVSKHDPLGVLAAGMLIGAVVLTVVSPPWHVHFDGNTAFGPWHLPVWLLLVSLAVLSTAVAYLAGMFSMRDVPSSVTSVLGLVEPVVATLLSWWLLDEALGPDQVLGAVVLLAGATVVQLASSRAVSPDALPRPDQDT